MSIPTIPQYYHQIMERGLGVIETKVWAAAASTSLTLTPDVKKVILIRGVKWTVNDTFDLGAGNTLEISPLKNSVGTTLSIGSLSELMTLSDNTPPSSGATTKLHHGVIWFKPFIILKSSSTPIDVFEFALNSVGAFGAGADFLNIAVFGCEIDEADLGLGVE